MASSFTKTALDVWHAGRVNVLERLPGRPGCATVRTDRATDSQVERRFVFQRSCRGPAGKRAEPDVGRYLFHWLLPGAAAGATVALAKPGSKSRRRKRVRLYA